MEISNYFKNKIKKHINSSAPIKIDLIEDEDEEGFYGFIVEVGKVVVFRINLTQMPFCCAYTIIGNLYVSFQYKELANFLIKEIENMLIRDNTTTIITTTAEYQNEQLKFFTDNGYSVIHKNINVRTGNKVTMLSKTLFKKSDIWSNQK